MLCEGLLQLSPPPAWLLVGQSLGKCVRKLARGLLNLKHVLSLHAKSQTPVGLKERAKPGQSPKFGPKRNQSPILSRKFPVKQRQVYIA